MSLAPLTEETYAGRLRSGKALVFFTAEWSEGAGIMRPLVEELTGDFPQIHFFCVDFDEEQQCALEAGVATIPTLLFFDGGLVRWKRTGVVPMETLRSLLSAEQ